MELIGGRWELREPIASGGTSTVWRAFDHALKTECAAKVLRQRDAGEILRFAREQSRRLVGDHIVAPYAWVADDGTALIAFELVTGGSLYALIGDYGPLSDGTVVIVLDQLLDALEGVHMAGIVHRDVKPANVLLRATGEGPLDLALTDFGIAISVTDARLTMVGMVIGTPGYLPPEVMRRDVPPEPAHDLYALGCLATALVLGHEDGTPTEALARIADPALAETVQRLTAEDPMLRPGYVGQVRALLAEAKRERTPHDREGEPITVLEHFAHLPTATGTTAIDPSPGAARPAAGGGAVSPATRPTGGSPPSHPTLAVPPNRRGSAAQGPIPQGPVPQRLVSQGPAPQGLVSQGPVTPAAAAVPPGVAPAGVVAPPPLPDVQPPPGPGIVPQHGRAPRRRRRIVVSLAAVFVAIVTGVGVWIGVGMPGIPGLSEPEVVYDPTAPKAGEQCTWLTEGDIETSSDGVELQCRLVDGEYVWQER